MVLFTFTLDLATVNARVIVKYNKKDYSDSKEKVSKEIWCTKTFTTTIERFPLKSVTHRVINDILESCNENITADLAWKSHGYREV